MTARTQRIVNGASTMAKAASKGALIGTAKTLGVSAILYVLIAQVGPAAFEKGANVFRDTIREHSEMQERMARDLATDRRELVAHLTKGLDRTNVTIEKNSEVVGAATAVMLEAKSVLWRINNKLEKNDKIGFVGPPSPECCP